MPHWRKMMDQRFIGSWDLDDDYTGTISGVKAEELTGPQGKAKKPTVSFEGAKKRLVCNATICKTIAAMYGNDTADWIGKKITIYTTTCEAFGETMDCVRVRPQVPK